MLTDEVKEAEENDEQHHIVSEALNVIAPGHPTISRVGTTPMMFTEPTTAGFSRKNPRTRSVPYWRQPSELRAPIILTIAMSFRPVLSI